MFTPKPRYSHGTSVKSNRVKASPVGTFPGLVEKHLSSPFVIRMNRADFVSLPNTPEGKAKRLNAKDGPYLTACVFDADETSRERKFAEKANCCNLLFLDLDTEKDGTCPAAPFVANPDSLREAMRPFNFAAYTTASSTAEKPRMRIVVDADNITLDSYAAAVKTIAARIGLANITKESLTPNHCMICPSVFADSDADEHPMLATCLDGREFTTADVQRYFDFDEPPATLKSDDAGEGSLEKLRSRVEGLTLDDLKKALAHISPDCEYSEWLSVVCGLKHQFGDDDTGYALFDSWSSNGTSYPGPDGTLKKWNSVSETPNGRFPVTIRTLLKKAAAAGWPDPRKPAPHPLPASLLDVPSFDCETLLPLPLRGYVDDCAERLQVDPAFVAVPLIVALGSVLGNRLGLRPKILDDYTEVPNIWGAIMGRPGTLKSPAQSAGMRPLHKLEAKVNELYQQGRTEWRQQQVITKIQRAAATEKAKAAIKKGLEIDAASLGGDDDETGPPLRRFVCNDASPESIHSILSRPENATGTLIFTDELSGLIARMSDPERGAALRSFLLAGWNGNQAATVDRIGRGENLRVDRCCVSVMGGIQPGKLAPLVEAAVKESVGDDGLIQRFSLLVYPDAPEDFKCIDRVPDAAAFAEVMGIFERAEATPGQDWAGAEHDESRDFWFIRLEPSASALFMQWMETETRALRAGEVSAAVESHFIKYRKAVCALALLFHVVEEHDQPFVSMGCLQRALRWVDYLKAHALRIYGSKRSETAKTANRILDRLRKRDLPEKFTINDVKRPCWSGLTDGEAVKAALAMLVDHGWLTEAEVETAGRPRIDYTAHPQIFAK